MKTSTIGTYALVFLLIPIVLVVVGFLMTLIAPALGAGILITFVFTLYLFGLLASVFFIWWIIRLVQGDDDHKDDDDDKKTKNK